MSRSKFHDAWSDWMVPKTLLRRPASGRFLSASDVRIPRQKAIILNE